MSTSDDDKLYKDIFGDEEEVPRPKAPAEEVEQPEAESPAEGEGVNAEAMGRDAATVFAEMLAGGRSAAPVAERPAEPVEEESLATPTPFRRFTEPETAKPKKTFKDAVAPWTLFRGVSVLAMVVYIIGSIGTTLADAWLTLLVITVALTATVLIVDYLRLSETTD